MAEEKTNLTVWQQNLSNFFRAMLPCLFIQTAEEERALLELMGVIRYLGVANCGCRNIMVWSSASLTQYTLWAKKGEAAVACKPQTVEYRELFAVLNQFAKPEQTNPDFHAANILMLADAADALTSATNVRFLKETIRAIRGTRKTIVLIGKYFNLPADVQNEITVVPFELPQQEELKATVESILSSYRSTKGYESVQIKDEQIDPFTRACAGITEHEMRNVLSLAVAANKAFDERAVTRALVEKSRIVQRSRVLEAITPKGALSQVGGLENVKAWVDETTPILQRPAAAHEYGLKLPSGLLLLGVSGTGKSLTSEAIAAHWQLPLLNFDVGRAFGGVLGETESNIREVIAVAEATAPCVLRIDEIEKGLGGDSLDGGTSQRVLATLLNWLENKPENVFVIATANDIRALSKRPELLQRFSESFFVDLPDMRSRIEILSIHLAPKHSIPADDLVDIAKVLKGYSGREIRNVVRKGLAAAFKSGAKHPSCSQMMAAAKLIVPTSHTLREQITELRKWCLDGRAIPAGATLEADNKDEQSFKVDGLPDLGN